MLHSVRFLHEGGHSNNAGQHLARGAEQRQSSRSLEVFFERARFTTEQRLLSVLSPWKIEDQEPVTLSHDEVLNRFMDLEGLNPAEEDLRSLAGIGDRRFLQAVAEGRPASPSFEVALRAHEMVAACYRSAASTPVPGTAETPER